MKFGTTGTVVHRDHADKVISDETLGDIAALGFSKEDIARCAAGILLEDNRN
jgi:hypothetical protein